MLGHLGEGLGSGLFRLLSHVLFFVHKASLFFTISQSFLKLMSIESVMPSNHLILCHPFLLLPSIFPSIRVFSKDLALRISFSVSPSSEYSGSISFRMDWFDLLAVQGTLESSPEPQFKSINSLALGIGICQQAGVILSWVSY